MSRTAVILLLTTLLLSSTFAQERNTKTRIPQKGGIVRDELQGGAIPLVADYPLSSALNVLPEAEATGSTLTLHLPASATESSRTLAHEIESLWNANKRSDAVLRYADLCQTVNPRDIEVGVTYAAVKSDPSLARITANVPIGTTADSVRMVGLATDTANGNLFLVTLVDQDQNGSTMSHWVFYASTDGGSTWARKYSWNAAYPINSISMAVVHHYCYVGFSRRAEQTQVLVYRFSTVDGSQATFADGGTYDTVLVTTLPEAVNEVRMFSNHESLDNRLYCAALTSEGNIKTRWEEADSVTWYGLRDDIGGAKAGVSATYNLSSGSNGYYWISYVDTANVLCVDSSGPGGFYRSTSFSGADEYSAPSITAYKDTIFCASEIGLYIVYLIRYGNQSDWYWGYGPDTTLAAEQAVATMSRGDGIGLAYRYYTPTRQGLFSWRKTSTPGWTPSVKFTDVEEYYVPVSMVSLGGGSYGVVYVSWDPTSYFQAFFALTSPGVTGVPANSAFVPLRTELYQNFPNPFNPSTTIQYRLASSGPVRISVYNALGQELGVLYEGIQTAGDHSVRWDGRNASSGAYFVRLVAGGQSLTRMMLLVK